LAGERLEPTPPGQRAAKWFRKGVDQRDPSQFDFGIAYALGKGVPQDYPEAVKWYRKAADEGLDVAQYDLGLIYVNGLGIPQDYIQAHMWFNLAGAGRWIGPP